MAETVTLQVPDSAADLFRDPQRVRDAFVLLNRLAALEVHLVSPASTKGLYRVTVAGQNASLDLPLKFRSAVADPSGGVTVDTQCRAQLAALLARLRETGQNPA